MPPREGLCGAAQKDGERGVCEEQVLWLGQQERERVGATGRERARVMIRVVAGGGDGIFNRTAGIGRHPVAAVDDARHRAARDAGCCGHVPNGGLALLRWCRHKCQQ